MHRAYVDHIVREVDSILLLINELQTITRNFDSYEFEQVSMKEIRKHLELASFGLERLSNAV